MSKQPRFRFSNSKYVNHFKGLTCGFPHISETEVVEDVFCPHCLQKLSMEFHKKEQTQKYTDNLSRAIVIANALLVGSGCSCGSRLIQKRNKVTRDRFMGCDDYPACKNTYSFIQFPEECQIKQPQVQEVVSPILATSLYQKY